MDISRKREREARSKHGVLLDSGPSNCNERAGKNLKLPIQSKAAAEDHRCPAIEKQIVCP